jgi:hypothetical protein
LRRIAFYLQDAAGGLALAHPQGGAVWVRRGTGGRFLSFMYAGSPQTGNSGEGRPQLSPVMLGPFFLAFAVSGSYLAISHPEACIEVGFPVADVKMKEAAN